MQRVIDFCFAVVGLVVLSPLFLILFVIGLWDTGSPIFRQVRVGRELRPFTVLKFRTMTLNTVSVATHLADASAITPFGRFLRRTKLDELPQLWNVLTGDMSLVGPRPCLPSQTELIEARLERGVLRARPGITGLSQILGIDMSMPQQLARSDAEMLNDLSLRTYIRYIILTILGYGAGDRVKGKTD